jgi:death-on-curing protein
MEGIRDEGLLESALSKPLHRFHYEDAGLFELAASYAAGIVKNHPFLDGNKRTGFFTAAFFLEKNGFKLNASEAEAAVMTVGLASGECIPEAYAEWLKDTCNVL